MKQIVEWMQACGITQFEITSFLRLVLASVCGDLIGLEREMRGRPAGLKTFSLVCMGSTLAMITNEYLYRNLAGESGDPARMAAQVISGIGFLGAGTIMITGHNQVKGLTTAAALWVTASIGIAIGTGFYFGGVAGVIVLFISSMIYRTIDQKIMMKSRLMRIYVEGIHEEFMLCLIEYFEKEGIKVISLTRRAENKWYKKDTCAMIELQFEKRCEHSAVLKGIQKLDGLRYVEEV